MSRWSFSAVTKSCWDYVCVHSWHALHARTCVCCVLCAVCCVLCAVCCVLCDVWCVMCDVWCVMMCAKKPCVPQSVALGLIDKCVVECFSVWVFEGNGWILNYVIMEMDFSVMSLHNHLFTKLPFPYLQWMEPTRARNCQQSDQFVHRRHQYFSVTEYFALSYTLKSNYFITNSLHSWLRKSESTLPFCLIPWGLQRPFSSTRCANKKIQNL